MTSGAVALLLSARPDLTPDQVKHILTSSAKPLAGVASNQQGAGRLELHGFQGVPAGPQTQQTPVATGLGSLRPVAVAGTYRSTAARTAPRMWSSAR